MYPDKPADECIVIHAGYGSVSVYAEGKHFRTVVRIPDAAIEEEGFVTVTGKKMDNVLKAFEKTVSISGPCDTDSNAKEIILSSDGCEYALPHVDIEMQHDFMPGFATPAIGEINADIISRVIYAAASDEVKNIALQGIRFSGEAIVATNGQRLACYDFPLSVPVAFTIHRNVLTEVSSLGQATIRAIVGDDPLKEVTFTSGNIGIACNPIDRGYPDYQRIAPAEGFKQHITVKRWPLLRALLGAAAICDQDTRVVRLTFSDEVVISTTDVDFGRMVEAIPLVTPVNDLQEAFYFNVSYLTDIISHVKSKEVVFRLCEPNKVAMLRDGDYGYCFVMPIRQQEGR